MSAYMDSDTSTESAYWTNARQLLFSEWSRRIPIHYLNFVNFVVILWSGTRFVASAS